MIDYLVLAVVGAVLLYQIIRYAVLAIDEYRRTARQKKLEIQIRNFQRRN